MPLLLASNEAPLSEIDGLCDLLHLARVLHVYKLDYMLEQLETSQQIVDVRVWVRTKEDCRGQRRSSSGV